ncbi:type II toxin-antitoxin system VapC family toxin [Saccharicrinis sp. FJH54]|uniref:type II toxin-antitoxin system VapC family toxin n=1 Tax=Saccharicrinis sp. FJH54 TaxID=3344665 RepID=UPI0035D5258D
MRNLLIDTNVVLDLLSKRKPFYDSAAKIFSLADKRKLNLSISSLTFANTNYVLTRLKSADEAREILRKFRVLVNVFSLDDKIIDLALNDSNFKDFEDGLQYYSAIENGQEIIITRDLKDFKKSRIPVLTPEEYLISVE